MGDLTGFGTQLLTAGVNAGLNYLSMEQQYDYSRRLADQQNQANLAMWNRNNAYNSPVQQMARLKAAGLNPQLAYGNQPQSEAPAMVGGSTPTSVPPQLSGSDMLQAALLRSQKDNIDADTADKLKGLDLKDTEIGLNNANIELLGTQNDWTKSQIHLAAKQAEEIDQNIAQSQAQIEAIKEQVNVLKSQRDLTDLQAMEQYINTLYAHNRNNAELRRLQSEYNLNSATIKRILTLLPFDANEISQHTKNMRKEHVLLVQAIQTGKIPANLASKYSELMEFLSLWNMFNQFFGGIQLPNLPIVK